MSESDSNLVVEEMEKLPSETREAVQCCLEGSNDVLKKYDPVARGVRALGRLRRAGGCSENAGHDPMTAVESNQAPAFDLRGWYEAQGIAVEHPVLRLPGVEQVRALLARGEAGKQELKELLERREKLIGLMESDPLRYGWEPGCWKDARELLKERPDLLVMGGNRSAKTEFAAKEAIDDLVTKDNRIWAFLHSSEDSSKRLQHPRLHRYLPPEWRDLGKVGKKVFILYTEQRGFSDNTFILPNGSKGFFFNYKQDPKVLEGYEFNGVWADELIPPEFLVALRFRLVTRRGRMIVTFTPIEGYTPTVGDYLGAAKVTRHLPAELLPGENVKGVPAGRMPYVMECVHPKRAVIFFFTEFNKFNPYDELKRELATDSTSKVKMRAYGYPDRAKGNIFPKFGNHNLVSEARVEALLREEGTLYLYADFAWARNWLLQWFWAQEFKGKKRITLIEEWPDFGSHGEWVVPSRKADGDRGPAQTPLGYGFKDYKRLIRGIERRLAKLAGRPLPVFERRCDPRSGAAAALSDEGGTCIMDKMREDHGGGVGLGGSVNSGLGEEGGDGDGSADLGPMDFLPASGDDITEGVNAINAWLEYDDGKPIDMDNEPIFHISERCRNVIDCFRIWTGMDGQKGAAKDPIDLPRYAAKDDIGHVDQWRLGSEGGGSY